MDTEKKQIFHVGDKVFNIHYGWGVVFSINKDLIQVELKVYDPMYIESTRLFHSNELSFTEYKLVAQGFSHEKPKTTDSVPNSACDILNQAIQNHYSSINNKGITGIVCHDQFIYRLYREIMLDGTIYHLLSHMESIINIRYKGIKLYPVSNIDKDQVIVF